MTTKIYKQYKIYLLPRHIKWAEKQAKKSGISVSHLERIIKDILVDYNGIFNIDVLVKMYDKKKSLES